MHIRIRLSASPTFEARKMNNLCWQTTPSLQNEDVSRSIRSGRSDVHNSSHITTSHRQFSRPESRWQWQWRGEGETESQWTNTARHHHASHSQSFPRPRSRPLVQDWVLGAAWFGSFVRRARSFAVPTGRVRGRCWVWSSRRLCMRPTCSPSRYTMAPDVIRPSICLVVQIAGHLWLAGCVFQTGPRM